MCAISKPDHPYPGLAVATTVCDRSSLAAAAWELFERWWGEGAPSKDNWIVLAQGFLGDDSTVAALVPLIRRWPGESGTARAQSGLDALAAIGSSRSLTELHDMSRRMKFKSLKNGAAQRVTEVAESLGLDQDQLGDRIVPDLELPVLDYGGRTFTIEFTETLVPYVIDEKGKKAKSLPKPIAGDDPAMAEAARTQFTAFKREVKAVATEQIKRLNRAMVTGRRWSADEFSQYLLGHPLMVHLVRRLLWASWGEDGSPAVVLRVAVGNTCADVDDRTIARPEEMIGLVHPAHIPESISAWSEVFADHEILQPFPQLGRPVHDPKPEDVNGSGLDRFTGVTATPSQALRLTYRGWEPVWENPASWGQGLLYRLGDSMSVLLGLEPGMGTEAHTTATPIRRWSRSRFVVARWPMSIARRCRNCSRTSRTLRRDFEWARTCRLGALRVAECSPRAADEIRQPGARQRDSTQLPACSDREPITIEEQRNHDQIPVQRMYARMLRQPQRPSPPQACRQRSADNACPED